NRSLDCPPRRRALLLMTSDALRHLLIARRGGRDIEDRLPALGGDPLGKSALARSCAAEHQDAPKRQRAIVRGHTRRRSAPMIALRSLTALSSRSLTIT